MSEQFYAVVYAYVNSFYFFEGTDFSLDDIDSCGLGDVDDLHTFIIFLMSYLEQTGFKSLRFYKDTLHKIRIGDEETWLKVKKVLDERNKNFNFTMDSFSNEELALMVVKSVCYKFSRSNGFCEGLDELFYEYYYEGKYV